MKLKGFIVCLLNDKELGNMNLKLKAWSLQIKYKLTIEKYSHEWAIRFSKNKDFY